MAALVDKLGHWAREGGREVTVVFERPPQPPITSSEITVAHAPRARANSADDEIVRLVLAGRPQDLTVVTSDGTLADRVRALGASVYPTRTFRDLIDHR